ncbi:MAG: hydantoinase B/oxoprolinase family protein [Deltaproteobacteria bacterium]|nr:hydantoinase B/oxoprolinase family protein [Deltaproteobacteria bacterium]
MSELDPFRYEIFRHRLYQVLEEGRLAIHRVSGSPVVVEGGECMCSFYDADGTAILTACGLLLHCTGCSTAIERAIEWYQESPGIHDGDQLFFNDPYIAATHVFDMFVIKPIFHEGRRIWQEGVAFKGLKIVEGGKFRPDVFNTVCGHSRDPHLVGLDTKAKIAANNVCAANYLKLVDKFGPEFVQAASRRIIEDSDRMARQRLLELPDGTWRSRVYYYAVHDGHPKPVKVQCTMTKEADRVSFDFTGTSPQNPDTTNCTYYCSWSGLFVALAGHLFWQVPWNGGMVAPVEIIVPEGSLLNCRFPAANGSGPGTASMLEAAAHDCIVRMLYAGGRLEDVNAVWRSFGEGERNRYGGHNQHGGVVAQQIYDFFAGGLGGTPLRDGVHTGANMLNPQSSISDVELIEMNYPFLCLGRNHLRDSGGFGKHPGGMGLERLFMVYGSDDLTDTCGEALILPAAKGLFGGYPASVQDVFAFRTADLPARLARGEYPSTTAELLSGGWGEVVDPNIRFTRIRLRPYDILVNHGIAVGGGGYGDPLDRPPVRVARDVRDQAISAETALKVYGVVLRGTPARVDEPATAARREALRAERLREGVRLRPPRPLTAPAPPVREMRLHESLVGRVDESGDGVIACLRCGHVLGGVRENYRWGTLYRKRDLEDWPLRASLVSRRRMVWCQEFICPGCGTLLEVDLLCPDLDSEEPLGDLQVAPGKPSEVLRT